LRALGDLQITALHPGGASGKRFQSYWPWITSCADMLGLVRDGCIIFNVLSTCGVNLSHN
jgi:hypothetical protein